MWPQGIDAIKADKNTLFWAGNGCKVVSFRWCSIYLQTIRGDWKVAGVSLRVCCRVLFWLFKSLTKTLLSCSEKIPGLLSSLTSTQSNESKPPGQEAAESKQVKESSVMEKSFNLLCIFLASGLPQFYMESQAEHFDEKILFFFGKLIPKKNLWNFLSDFGIADTTT